MKDLSDIMRQAQEMQSKLSEAQEALEAVEASGTAGGGLVKVVLKGKGDLSGVAIDPSLMAPGEQEIVEDLIKAAHDDARRKLEEAHAEAMKSATAGLGVLPGFKMPF
ncbi:MAG: YbaB/EbfC family nucleoid-associated protein [Pseudomonadota bacterium]